MNIGYGWITIISVILLFIVLYCFYIKLSSNKETINTPESINELWILIDQKHRELYRCINYSTYKGNIKEIVEDMEVLIIKLKSKINERRRNI